MKDFFHFSLLRSNLGGNSSGVPPLSIPNREVKPIHADGTAVTCGRVGSRLLKAVSIRGGLSFCEHRSTPCFKIANFNTPCMRGIRSVEVCYFMPVASPLFSSKIGRCRYALNEHRRVVGSYFASLIGHLPAADNPAPLSAFVLPAVELRW